MNKFNANTTEKAFSEKLAELIGDSENAKVVVAFSGGADSLALLILCSKVLNKNNLFPLYVNHRIRTDSEIDREIDLNIENCRKLGLELHVAAVEKNELNELSARYGVEAAARKLRYRELENFAEANEIPFILTAHHKDDQLETVFMRMQRKAPVPSLRGIAEKNGKVCRPLLGFSKENLVDYVRCENFTWSTDSTNEDISFERNRIRNVLLPEFRSKNPDADSILLSIREKAVKECGGFVFDGLSIDLDEFNALDKTKKYIVLYSMWDRFVGGLLSVNMVERVIARCSGKTTYESASGGTFCMCGNRLFLVSDREGKEYLEFDEKLENDMSVMDFHCKIENDSSDIKALHFNISDAIGECRVRFVKPGDRIVLKSGSKTVIKILQDMKIPRPLRRRTPVIVDDGGIVAVFASVWGGKDRLSRRFLTLDYKNLPCVRFTCRD